MTFLVNPSGVLPGDGDLFPSPERVAGDGI